MAVTGQAYVYGSTVRQPEIYPGELRPSRPRKVSGRVHRNRKRELDMNKGYVLFLAVAAIAALIVCVKYLQLQSEITTRSERIAVLQRELSDLKEENSAMYSSATDGVNMEQVRQKAVEELGMHAASSEQVIEYDSPTSSYVKQYEDIPENGILANSSKASE